MIALHSFSRYQTARTRLGISAFVAATILAIMLALWYPFPLFGAMGGMELAALVVGVAALQLGTLCYDVNAMHAEQPVFTVFDGEKLAVVALLLSGVKAVMSSTEVSPTLISSVTEPSLMK